MFEIKTPDGFTHEKQLCCRTECGLGFSYDIEMISVIQDPEGNSYIREYSNCCDSGANGRPVTAVRDVGYKTERKDQIHHINAGNWKRCISLEELLHPSFVFENTGGYYVDQNVLDYVKNTKAQL